MDCFGTYFTHAQTCNVTRVYKVLRNGLLRYILYTCPNMLIPVFKVLRNGLLRYILYTCSVLLVPKDMQKSALRMLFSLMHLIGLNHKKKMLLEIQKKKLTPHSKGKNSSKRCTVGSANVPVWAYIIYIWRGVIVISLTYQQRCQKVFGSRFNGVFGGVLFLPLKIGMVLENHVGRLKGDTLW